MTTFGSTLRALRQSRPPALGQTQERRHRSVCALAQQAGVGHAHLSRMEHGTAFPRIASLARIADALGLSDAEIALLVRSVPHGHEGQES